VAGNGPVRYISQRHETQFSPLTRVKNTLHDVASDIYQALEAGEAVCVREGRGEPESGGCGVAGSRGARVGRRRLHAPAPQHQKGRAVQVDPGLTASVVSA